MTQLIEVFVGECSSRLHKCLRIFVQAIYTLLKQLQR